MFQRKIAVVEHQVKSTTTFTMYTPRGSFKLVFYRKTTISVPHCLSVEDARTVFVNKNIDAAWCKLSL